MYFNTTNCVKVIVCDAAMLYVITMVCGVAINPLEISLILQPAYGDVRPVHVEIG